MINNELDYKVALFLRKNNYEFLNALGIPTVEQKQDKTDPSKLLIDIADIFSSGAIYLKDKDNKNEPFWFIDFSNNKESIKPTGFKEINTSFKGKEPNLNTIGNNNEEPEIRKNYEFEEVWKSESIKNLSKVFSDWAKDAEEIKFFTPDLRKLNDNAIGFTVWKKYKNHWYHFNIAWNFSKPYQFEQAALSGVHFSYLDNYSNHKYLELGNLIPVAVEELRVLNYINSKSEIFKNRGYKKRRLPDSLFIRHSLSENEGLLTDKERNEMYQGEVKIDIDAKDIESLTKGSWKDRWGNWFINSEKVEKVDPIEKYKKWCKNLLSQRASNSNLWNIKNFCFHKLFRTGEERLKYDGRIKFSKEQLFERFDLLGISKLKNNESNTLIRDLGHNELKNSKEKFGEAYLKYCEKEGNKLIFELDYSKYSSRCSFKK